MVVNVGVIGCGAIARRGHLPAYSSLPNVRVKAVADINLKKAKSIAKKFKIKKYYKDFRRLLEDSSIELVSICTPPQTHFEIAIEAAKSGMHILMEKPLALNQKEAKEIIKCVEREDVKLCMVFNYRYSPVLRKMKEVIDSGCLGKLVSIHGYALSHFPIGWTRSTWLYHHGGALDDFGPHLIDAVLWINEQSNVEKVYALGGDFLKTMGCINYIEAMIKFSNGCIATLDISWLTGSLLFKLDVHGTGGHVYGDVFSNNYLQVHGVQTPLDDFRNFYKKISNIVKGALSGRIFAGGMVYYVNLIRDFISSIEKDTDPPITGLDGLKTTKISEAIKTSLKEKRPINFNKIN